MARLNPDHRRQAIVDAALLVARRKGLATTTVRDVAAEMGTSSGLIHHYFHSMDQVLAAAFERAARLDLENVINAVADAPDPPAALAAFFEAYAPEESDWTFQLWLDAWSEAARRPALRETSAKMNVAWQQLMAGIIRDGVDSGDFTSADPEVSAWRIISVLDGLLLQVIAHRTTVSRERMLEWARGAAELELSLPLGALVGG
jgi:AcrR family transcriptional regulator